MDRDRATAILGVDQVADLGIIRAGFRILAHKFHPDRFLTPGERAVATRRFQDISEAYDWLCRNPVPLAGQSRNPPARSAASGRFRSDTITRDRVSGWELLDPLTHHPAVELLLDILLLPPLIMMAVTILPLSLLGNGVEKLHPRLVNLLYTLGAHLIPGVLAVALGLNAIDGPQWWSPVVGIWFIVGGGLSVVLEIAAQGIGAWKLRVSLRPSFPSAT